MIALYRLRSLFVVFACLPLGTSTAYAGDVDTAEARTTGVTPPAGEQIANSIRALSSSRYRDRTAATRKLITLGKDVIPHVAAAAETTDLEVAGRCVTILQHLFQSKDATIKAAAGSALLVTTNCTAPGYRTLSPRGRWRESPRRSVSGRSCVGE